MYSFDKSLKATGLLNKEHIEQALDIGMRYSDQDVRIHGKCAFLELEDGSYCIGTMPLDNKDGWREFPFEYDASILAGIILQHLKKQYVEPDPYADDYEDGFIMESVGFEGPSNGILMFSAISIGISK